MSQLTRIPDAQPSPATPQHSGSPTVQTLAQLPLGSRGRVSAIAGDPGFRQRLLELGVVPGVDLRVVRCAPLGDPIEIEVRGFRISVRKSEAATVTVEAEPNGSPPREPAPVAVPSARQMAGTNAPVTAATAAPHFRVAIAGNPNTGKTTLFNCLTGARARVGNYPGITVDRRIGNMRLCHDQEIELVDIPGTYSLNARSREEQLAMDEMLGRAGGRPPDALIIVLSATALARSLYLLLQVQEFGLPTLAVVNMADEAESQGMEVDVDALEKHFGLPFAKTSARSRAGLDQLRDKLQQLLAGNYRRPAHDWLWHPSEPVAAAIDHVSEAITRLPDVVRSPDRARAFALWCLMSLREDDHFAGIHDEVRQATRDMQTRLAATGHDLDIEVARERYRVIDQAMPQVLHEPQPTQRQRSITEGIDAILTHPLAGMLIFLTVMSLVFTAIFDWAAPLMDSIDGVFQALSGAVIGWLPGSILGDLLANGLIRGVGSVVTFLPQIIILFLFLTLLEGSGYMSRAAFMMDRVMRKIGLQGRAFVPMMSGYACAIPAIMATRTLDNRRDRLLTMMAIPLISCSARLPIFTLIIGTLFPAEHKVLGVFSLGTVMMLGLYVVSMVLALAAAGVLGRTVLRGRRPPLLIELPPYRLPAIHTVGLVLWQKARLFLRTAGTVIVAVSLILWVLLSLPHQVQYSRDYDAQIHAAETQGNNSQAASLRNAKQAEKLRRSYAGRLGRLLEPLIAPLGFDWKIGVGLIGSIAAREVFVATMGLVYGVGEANEETTTLRGALRSQRRADGSPIYTPLTGLSLLVFFMFAMQCMSTLAVVKQESRSWRWPAFMLFYLTTLAYLASLATYQLGSWLFS